MTREEYEENTRVLAAMVDERRKAHGGGGCDDPACMGPDAMRAFIDAVRVDAGWPAKLVLAAVAVMAGQVERVEELERLLEVQRGMTADAAACAMRVDADLVDAQGRVADLERSVASLTAELTLWEAE
jgi:hypothetical protein